jgi:hypothetical protein
VVTSCRVRACVLSGLDTRSNWNIPSDVAISDDVELDKIRLFRVVFDPPFTMLGDPVSVTEIPVPNAPEADGG